MESDKCGPCGGTGRVLDGEICSFCEDRRISAAEAAETLECLGYSDMAEAVRELLCTVYAAPIAIIDTRDALGICAPTEDDFPALYALQGKRVRLVLDEVPNAELTGDGQAQLDRRPG